MNSDNSIILQPNQPPQFVGEWTVGEIRAIAEGLLNWLYGLKVTSGQPPQEVKDDASS